MKKIILTIFFISQFVIFLPNVSAFSNNGLNVVGNKIYYNNEPIMLRGVAIGSPYYRVYKEKRNSQKDYTSIKKDWMANVVRISMHPGVFSYDRQKGIDAFEQEVEAARTAGLFVIIDWHTLGWPNGWFKPSIYERVYSYSSNFNLAKDFWTYASNRYKDDKGIIFEVWNEPEEKSDKLRWSDLKPYMENLFKVIRDQGADNIVLFTGVNWGYDIKDIANNPIVGRNVAYTWHNYLSYNYVLGNWDQTLNKLNEKYPVILSEWGWEKEGDTNESNYGEVLKNFILEKNLHFTAWAWHPDYTPAMWEKKWTGLTDYGEFVKYFLVNYESLLEDSLKTVRANDIKIQMFLNNGLDHNAERMSARERKGILDFYTNAFGKKPRTENDWDDLLKIASGVWPSETNKLAENKAMDAFARIYKRKANVFNIHDKAAIMIMAYGIKQEVKARNLGKEILAINKFKSSYKRNPSTNFDWNIVQAIAYSGVK